MHAIMTHVFNRNAKALAFASLSSVCCLALCARAADYFWQPVAGDWNGDWNDTAHWRSDAPGAAGYPSTTSDTASFIDCTLGHPVEVSVNGTYKCGTLRCFGTNASDIAFIGTDATSSSLACKPKSTDNTPADPIASNTKIEFRDMTLARSAAWLIVKKTSGITNLTVRFTRAVSKESNTIQLSAPFSRLELIDSDVQTTIAKLAGTNTVMLVDNSSFICTDFYVNPDIVNKDPYGNGNLQFVFTGKNACMTSTGSNFPYSFANGKEVRFVFRVPAGGYSHPPLSYAHSTGLFGRSSASNKDYIFEVAADSPAVAKGSSSKKYVLVDTVAGFNMKTVKSMSAPGKATLAWGFDGEPLADGDDSSVARQLLLNLPGAHTVFMVW